MQLHDFASIRLLGDGTSSTVQLVREKSTGLCYALKSVPEDDGQSVERGIAERNALLLFRGEDRVIQFYGSFRENQNFYIVTVSTTSSVFISLIYKLSVSAIQEYLSAGDLFGLIYTCADFFPECCKVICGRARVSLRVVVVTLPCIYLLAASCHRSHSQT